jgi:hypothetical protein
LGPYLCAGAGAGKKDAGCLAGESAGSTRGPEGAEALDDALNSALLAEAGLAESRKGDEND